MNLLLLVIFLLISAAFGMRLLHLFKFSFKDFKEKAVFSLALGLGIVAYFVFISGLLGLLYKWWLILLLLVLAIFSYKEFIDILKNIIDFLRNMELKKITPFEKLLIIFILSSIIFTFLGALAPPTGNDSLAYRLVHVRIFSEMHRLSYIPYTRESLWPYLIEMLFTLGMVIKSDILAKLIGWSFGLLSAFLIYIFTKEYFSKLAGYISSALFLLTPAIFTQMTYAYVDIPMAMYSFISLVSVLKYFRSRDIKWIALAGIFCGFVLSIKYIGLLTVFTIIAVFTYKFIKDSSLRKIIFKGSAVFLLLVFLFSFSWYFRSFIIKGNPVYPFFLKFFGHGWRTASEGNIGKGFSIISLIQLPWTIIMFPEKFGGEHFGVVYLLFLPLLLLINKNRDIFKFLGIFLIIYTVLWFFIDQYVVRFLFPILLPLSVLIGCGLSVVFKRRGYFYNFVKIVFVISCIFNTALLFYHNANKLKIAVGLESRGEYLTKSERTYHIAEYINKNLPLDATVLMVGEVRTYYIKRSYVHLNNLINEEKFPLALLERKTFLRKLKRYDIDYILYLKDEASSNWLQYLITQNKPVFTHTFIDKDRATFTYYLYDLNEVADI